MTPGRIQSPAGQAQTNRANLRLIMPQRLKTHISRFYINYKGDVMGMTFFSSPPYQKYMEGQETLNMLDYITGSDHKFRAWDAILNCIALKTETSVKVPIDINGHKDWRIYHMSPATGFIGAIVDAFHCFETIKKDPSYSTDTDRWNYGTHQL